MGAPTTTHDAPPPPAPGTVERRRGRPVLPWAVLALWIAVLAVAAPFAGKLGDVQRDNIVDYLPAGADSTQVARVQQDLPGGESTQLVLVYQREGGLTDADRRTARNQAARIAAAHELTAEPRGVPAADGATLMFPVSSTEPGNDEKARAAFVEDVRAQVSGGAGLTVEVGGPSALQTDMEDVFETIDGTLMIATVLVVAVLLVLTYRSPFLWLVPLLVVGAAAVTSRAVVHGLVQGFGLTVTSQSGGIMTVLVFGAGTDYALLLVARYREELRRVPHPYDAMRAALRGCGPAVLASCGTVVAGLLCLLAADLNSARGLGPVGAVGVVCALAAMLTLLPAVLVLLGRRVFWPLIPRHGSEATRRRSLFAVMGSSAGRRPVAVLVMRRGAPRGTLARRVQPARHPQERGRLHRPSRVRLRHAEAGRRLPRPQQPADQRRHTHRHRRPGTRRGPRDRGGGDGRARTQRRRLDGAVRLRRGRAGDHAARRRRSRPCGPHWTARTSAGRAPSSSIWRTPTRVTGSSSSRWSSRPS